MVLPLECKVQVEEDLTPDQIEGVKIHYATRIEEVLAVTLPSTVQEEAEDEAVREEVIHASA